MELTLTQALAAVAVIAVGALVQGSLGFGMALVAAPILIQIDPVFVPGPVLLAGMPLVVTVGWLERQNIRLDTLPVPLTGQAVGIVIGIGLLRIADHETLALAVGLVVLTAVAASAFGWRARPTPPSLAGAGVVAGFMGSTASLPGPPLALVYQSVPASQLRGTMAPFLLFGALFSLPGIAWAGRLGPAEWQAALLLLPGVAIGLALSRVATRRLGGGSIRTAVLVLSAVSALALIVRSL